MLPYFAWAAPAITNVSGVVSNDQGVTINGSGFGVKTQAAPVYWNNLEGETTGTLPSGWTISSKPGAVVSTADKWSGTKSLYFAMKQANQTLPGWNQIKRDLGASPKWYFYFKNKLKKNDDSTQFQWKSWRITSSPDGYAWNSEDSTTIANNDWWWDSTPRWFNASILGYNNAGAAALTDAWLSRSDAILLNQWQTLEEYIQMSSSPLVADGIIHTYRDGLSIVSKTDIITHDAGSNQWRYMLLGQGMVGEVGATTGVDADIYYDDIYIDNTQARVMLCDAATWAARSNCEIQIPTAWADGSVGINVNQGKFAANSNAYLYVVDGNGNANANGYAVTFATQADTTPPAAPTGLSVL